MRIKYVGPGPDGLEIADAGVTVRLGETVEVPDEIGAQLVERPDFKPAANRKKDDTKEGD